MNNAPLPVSALEEYPAADALLAERLLSAALNTLNRKIVVLDDDPTGVQTVHGVSVYTHWDEEAITTGFLEKNSLFFILTNSRGLSAKETEAIHRDIGETLCRVSAKTGVDYLVVSRSDSTLRGHFPTETAALREAIERNSGRRFDGEILCPYFREGGRFTLGDVHYVREGDQLTPAALTEFAADKTFGYKSSHMGEYVEEKTRGAYKKEDCSYISIEDLRARRVDDIARRLMRVEGFGKVIVNAAQDADVQVFVSALAQAILDGKEFLFRSAAALPKALGGISDRPLLRRAELREPGNENGGIVIIGSHVQRTTRQFEALRGCAKPPVWIEFDQHLVKTDGGLEREAARVAVLAEKGIASGKNAVVYTRRERFDLEGADSERQLQVSVQISDALTGVVARLSSRPGFILAKGGITSSDVGIRALGVRRATVMGQVKPGIPVWKTGPESRFPGVAFIIFPGNVGGDETLREIIDELSE